MPLISVVIPTCDRNPIPTIKSVLNQTYPNFEIIVVNDGTKDIWKEVRKTFDEWNFKRFILINHLYEKYRGASAARNDGIRASSGEHISCLDDDDSFSDPQHLELLSNYLEKQPKIDMVFSKSWAIKFPECDTIRAEIWIEELPDGKWKGVLPGQYYQPERIFWENPAPLPCFLFRKKCFDQAGLFDESLRSLNDFELISRFVLAGFKMEHLDTFTCSYSVHGKGINSKDPDQTAKIAQAIRRRFQCKAWRRGLIKT